MSLTDRERRSAAGDEAPDDGFEELRTVFCDRLTSERQRLLDLGAAVARGDANRAQLLAELRNHAHRLSGTAAIFELRGVAVLARALELAVEGVSVAAGAALPRAENSDGVMHAALRALAGVISSLGRPVREPSVHARIQRPRRARAMLNG